MPCLYPCQDCELCQGWDMVFSVAPRPGMGAWRRAGLRCLERREQALKTEQRWARGRGEERAFWGALWAEHAQSMAEHGMAEESWGRSWWRGGVSGAGCEGPWEAQKEISTNRDCMVPKRVRGKALDVQVQFGDAIKYSPVW